MTLNLSNQGPDKQKQNLTRHYDFVIDLKLRLPRYIITTQSITWTCDWCDRITGSMVKLVHYSIPKWGKEEEEKSSK